MTHLFDGAPVSTEYRADLLDTAGNPAHAATFVRRRIIVMDPTLKESPREHLRILLHEYFHFAWVRLGNQRRCAWEAFLRAELAARVRGEAGWSAEWRKAKLSRRDVLKRTRLWRDYCCESFCDTAAWIESRVDSEVTLALTRRRARRAWFRRSFPDRVFPI
jgi:hypothetical protein